MRSRAKLRKCEPKPILARRWRTRDSSSSQTQAHLDSLCHGLPCRCNGPCAHQQEIRFRQPLGTLPRPSPNFVDAPVQAKRVFAGKTCTKSQQLGISPLRPPFAKAKTCAISTKRSRALFIRERPALPTESQSARRTLYDDFWHQRPASFVLQR